MVAVREARHKLSVPIAADIKLLLRERDAVLLQHLGGALGDEAASGLLVGERNATGLSRADCGHWRTISDAGRRVGLVSWPRSFDAMTKHLA